MILTPDYTRVSARAVPFITKDDLRLSTSEDPEVDPEFRETGLRHLMSLNGEHYTYTGEKKRDEKVGTVFRYEAGQLVAWIGKDHQVYHQR